MRQLEPKSSATTCLPLPLCDVDTVQLARASHSATGADLKAIIEDGKLLFARDQTRKPARPPEEYFLDAVANIRRNRRRYLKRNRA
jgi:hypothetical protein